MLSELTSNDAPPTTSFLLTFHSNYGPISYTVSEINGDFSRKSQFFPPRVFNAPAEGVPLGIGYRRKGERNRMMGYQKI